MALGALSLSVTQGVQGRPFAAAISGLTTGRVEVLQDGSPGFWAVNGVLRSNGLPYPVSTAVLREYEPGVGAGYRDTRLEITATTQQEASVIALASMGAGRTLQGYTVAGTVQGDGSIVYSVYARDDLGATVVTAVGGGGSPPLAYGSYAERALVIDSQTPILDIDYENGRFYVGSTTYTSLAAAEAAGAVVVSGTTPIGDRWALPSYSGGITVRGMGTTSASGPVNGTPQVIAAIDDGADGVAADEQILLGRRYNAASDFRPYATNIAAAYPSNTEALGAITVANNSPFVAAAAFGTGGSGAGRITVKKRGSTTSISAGVSASLTHLTVGDTREGTRPWGGTVKRITVYSGALAVEQAEALGCNEYLDERKVPLWATGYINPMAVCIGDYTYVAGYMPSCPFAVAINNANGADYALIHNYRRLGTTPTTADDHNRPSILVRPDNVGFSFAWCDHSVDGLIRQRYSTSLDLKNYSASNTTYTASANGNVAYNQQFAKPNSAHVYNLVRQVGGSTNWRWSWIRSTNNGVTWATSGTPSSLFTHTDQFYIQGRFIDDDTMLFFINENPTGSVGKVRIATWNVTTNQVYTGDGAGGTTLIGTAPAAVSSLMVFKEDPGGTDDWGAGVFAPSHLGIACMLSKQQEVTPGGLPLRAYANYAKYSGTGDIHDPANWTITEIAGLGVGAGFESRFGGGSAISQLSTLTVPRVFLGQHVGSEWQITQWDASDATGTSWTKTSTLRTVSDASYNVAFRPISPVNCSENLQVLWMEGYYYNYDGTNLDLYQCWDRDDI